MHPLAVCSWSLRPAHVRDLVGLLEECGVPRVQLALGPIRAGAWKLDETRDLLAQAGVAIVSGMMATHGEDYSSLESIRTTGGVRPDAHWSGNLDGARRDAETAQALGISLVSFHAGFLPEEPGAERSTLIERLRQIVDVFAERGIDCAFETGQESAQTLLGVLAELERPRAGVNFDPANMILYGMGEPLAALEQLAPHVRQVHIKDALPAERPGEWGTEVPVGEGAVDWAGFFAILERHALEVDCVVEREAGEARVGDVRRACEVVRGVTR